MIPMSEDDKELDRIYNDCKGGTQFCGQCKKLVGDYVSKFLSELQRGREEAKNNLEKYLHYIALGNEIEMFDYKTEKVPLMTLHASKGLEFDCVFIIGCEKGFIPYNLFVI